jgi:hypothetical protein
MMDQEPGGIWPPEFSIGAILSDAFARYAADPIRLYLVALPPAIASLVGGLIVGSEAPDLASIGRYLIDVLVFGLAAVAVGLLGTSVTFALLEIGPEGDAAAAIGRGVERVGWLLATWILIALAILAVSAAAVIPAVLTFPSIGPLSFVLGFLAVLVAIWLGLRLFLAVPAVVVDRLNAFEAIRLSWAVTRPTAVWLRLLGALIVLGLLVAPASFFAGAIGLVGPLAGAPAVLLGVAGVALISPLASALYHAAYRRLVPRIAVATTGGAAVPQAVGFDAPVLGTRGRALIGATLVVAIVGLVSVPFTIGAALSRQLDGPDGVFPGNVPAGTVAFGTSGNLRTCTVQDQFTVAAPFSPVVFMGHLATAATPDDEVRLLITVNGTQIVNEIEERSSYACLGTGQAETDIGAGTYLFQVFLNGQVSAQGTLVVE